MTPDLTPTVPILASASAATALALYLNAKHHIAHDLRGGAGTRTPSRAALSYLSSRAAQKRVLTYYVLENHARLRPNHPFLIFEGKTWSYGQFFNCIVRVGNWLIKELGVREGEMVAIDGGNSAEYLMLWFALDAVGAVTSFVNYNLTGAGLVHCVKVRCLSFLVLAAYYLASGKC